jgi:hypothetical protein
MAMDVFCFYRFDNFFHFISWTETHYNRQEQQEEVSFVTVVESISTSRIKVQVEADRIRSEVTSVFIVKMTTQN